jgi:hypothetical protein
VRHPQIPLVHYSILWNPCGDCGWRRLIPPFLRDTFFFRGRNARILARPGFLPRLGRVFIILYQLRSDQFAGRIGPRKTLWQETVECSTLPARPKMSLDPTNRGTNDESWHSLHDVNRPGLADYSQVQKPPTIDGCVEWVQGILDRMEPLFDEFRRQLSDVPSGAVRLCWVAHLVADFAASYYYVGTGKEGKYKDLKDKKALWDFVTEVGGRLLPKE